MSPRWFRQSLPPRLPQSPESADFQRMARNPSAYAPTATEVLTPPQVALPVPVVSPSLRAVLDRPNDDAPRLAYADAIRTSDPARAEFIQLQLNGDPGAERLLSKHGARWAVPFAQWGGRDFVFRRGFIEALSLTGRSFISFGAGLFEMAPIREVRLIALNFLMEELIACAHLAKLEALNLRGNQLGPVGAERLMACRWLDGLKALDLAGNGLTAECETRLRAKFEDRLQVNVLRAVPQ